MLKPMFITGSLIHGGAERHSITVMNRLAERGYPCHAVYIKNDPSQLDRIQLPDPSNIHCLNATRYLDVRALLNFAAHLARVKPTVLIAANGYALMYASLARILSRSRMPLMVTFHTTQVVGVKEQLNMFINRPFFWGATQSVFVCEKQRQHWLRRGVGSRKNTVIYNGVDTGHFCDGSSSEARHTLRSMYGFADNDYVIGISAVLRHEKNHLQLIDALASLRSTGIPAQLLIIGDGPMRLAIEARAQEKGVANAIHITGFQQDVRPCITACDVMVLSSISETFSLAALEAMAIGKPFIHSEVGGAAEMIFPGRNGFLFARGDTQALVQRLTTLANKTLAQQMGQQARALVEKNFSERVMVDRYEKLLLQLCATFADIPSIPGATESSPAVLNVDPSNYPTQAITKE